MLFFGFADIGRNGIRAASSHVSEMRVERRAALTERGLGRSGRASVRPLAVSLPELPLQIL